jgi:hypothetical protein
MFCDTNNWYSALKNVYRDSASDEFKLVDKIPSASREYKADPVSEITPSERNTVERMTFVTSECRKA